MSELPVVPLAVRTRRSLAPTADPRTKARVTGVLTLSWLTLVAVGWTLVAGF